MKVMYQTPEIELIGFKLQGKLMDDGYDDGDVLVNPWEGTLDDESADDTGLEGM